ncbi:hypothetical protein Bbelb_312220 [Branchiostoma belcheri]|nr:hypothetical protein Bbelb_312220 [Branchiostoma belcheri]
MWLAASTGNRYPPPPPYKTPRTELDALKTETRSTNARPQSPLSCGSPHRSLVEGSSGEDGVASGVPVRVMTRTGRSSGIGWRGGNCPLHHQASMSHVDLAEAQPPMSGFPRKASTTINNEPLTFGDEDGISASEYTADFYDLSNLQTELPKMQPAKGD